MLDGMVDGQRAEIAAILDDLTEEEARSRLVPSLTTPLGLVKHATFVEQIWFHSRVAGRSRTEVGIPDTVDESFVLEPGDTIDGIRRAHAAACERSRAIARDHGLDDEFAWYEQSVTLRFILQHMIRELARHAGHGDILVEQVRARRDAAQPG